MMKKRIMGTLLTISLTIGIAGCTTNGATAPTTQPTTMVVVPKRTTVLETAIQETTVATLPIHMETTTAPTTAKVVSNVNSDQEELSVEHTVPSTVPVTTEPMMPMFEDIAAFTSATSATVPTIVAPTSSTTGKTANNWGIVSTSTDVETSTGNVPVERGAYILIISESESSYTISWYGSTASIAREFIRVIGHVSLDEETEFLQRKTVGVITP